MNNDRETYRKRAEAALEKLRQSAEFDDGESRALDQQTRRYLQVEAIVCAILAGQVGKGEN